MKTQSQPISLPERLTQRLRRPAWKKAVSSVLLAQFALWSMQVQGVEGTWTLNNASNWTGTPANWQGGVIPNGVGDIAIFRNDITAARTVTLNAPITLGGLKTGDLFGGSVFTYGGTGMLTMSASSGNAFINKYGSGTDVIASTAFLDLSSNTDFNIYTGAFDVNAAVTGAGNIIKSGAGTLTFRNTTGFTGDFVLNFGTMNFSGASGATSNQLGTGTGGITLIGTPRQDLTILGLRSNGPADDGTVVYNGNNDVILSGGASINVDRNFDAAAGSRVNHELDNLTINGGVLRVTSGNSHRLTFSGTTTLLGQTNVIEPQANGTATLANLTLTGVITDGAATSHLTKDGAGRLAVTNIANTYDGVTTVKNGVLQLNAAANLGAGKTYVNGGVLSVADTATLDGVSAAGGLVLVGQLGTSRFSLPNVGYFGSVAIDSGNPMNVDVPVAGMVLGVDGVTGTTSTNAANIDLAYVGSGSQRVWLGNVVGFDRTYTGTLTNGASDDLRLLAGSNTLIISGSSDRLGGAGATNNLIFGYDHANAINFTGNHIGQATALLSGTTAGNGTVSVRVDNSNTLGTVTVNRGVTVNINGAITTPLGTGTVTSLGGNITTDNTSAAKFGNTNFLMFGGGTLLLDNSAVTVANADRRLDASTNVSLTSSTLRLLGEGAAAVASSQTLNAVNLYGGSTISVETDGTTSGRLTTLTLGSLNRNERGTLMVRNIANTATTLGTATGTQKLILTSAPTVTNGMIGANVAIWGGGNLNDSSQPLFATYDSVHGVQAATFTNTAFSGTTTNSIVDLSGAAVTAGTQSVQALRFRSTTNTHTLTGGSLTIGAAAGAGQGAGIFFAHTSDNEVIHTTPITFAGGQEGMMYVATTGNSSAVRLNGNITGTNGLTKFGDGRLRLAGTNNFGGPLTINSGEVRLVSVAAAGPITGSPTEINIWGGSLFLQTTGLRHNNNVNFYNDGRLGNDNVASTMVNNITVQPRTDSTSPVVVWVQNPAGGQFTTANGALDLAGPAQLSVVHPFQINAGITGTGNLDKFMNERLVIAGDSSSYSGNITAYAGVLQSYIGSSTAKPFGNSNTITINPGAHIVLAAATNISSGQVTVNSDHGGISTIGQFFVADPATDLPAMTINSSAPWKASFGVGAVGFSVDIDQTSLFGGNTFLGGVLGHTGIYTGNLTPSASGYLLGGSQGGVRIEKPLTGNVNAIIGISMTETGSRADQTVNNSGGAVTYTTKMAYTGNTILNPGPLFRISARNALDDTGDLILAGGQLRADSNSGQNRLIEPIVLKNKVIMTADSLIQMENSAYDFRISGNIELAPGSTGIVRALSIGTDQAGASVNNAGMVYLDGGISDGAGGSGNHFIKNGPGTLFFTGTNTYTGSTTIQQGLIAVNADTDWGLSTGSIISAGGGIAIWENSFTTNRNYSAHGGNMHVDVASGLTLTQAASSVIDGTSSIVKRGLGTLILNGENAVSGLFVGDGILQFNSLISTANSASTGSYSIGGDVTIGGANNPTRYTGGTMRFNFTGTTTRTFVFNNNGNTNFSGGIDITAGNTLTASGVISQGTELDYGFKTGPGTLITTAANTWRGLAMTNGVLQFANSAPWGNGTGNAADNTFIDMLGGNIRAVNAGASITLANAVSTTTYNYGGGMTLSMGSGAGFSVEFAADNLLRQNQGTLVLQTLGATTLGGAGATNSARMIVTNAVNGSLARASAVNNGIFGAHLLGSNESGEAYFLQNNATTGFEAYSGSSNTSLNGLAPTSIGNITSEQTLTGINSIYALRTTADISGGILKVTAIDNIRLGGVLLNDSNTISSGLVFDPTSSNAPGTGTPGEGLVYVKSGANATISGGITANAFTKFGNGTLTLSGSNAIAGDISVQSGTLKLGSANVFSRMNSELNINAGATLDLNGFSGTIETIGSNNRLVANALIGGTITNTSGTSATLAMAGPISSAFSGVITGNTKLLKAGLGTLTLNGYSASTPDSGVNSHTAGTDIYGYNTTGGINLNNSTLALGGGNGGASQVNLFNGQLGLFYSNGTTGVNNTHGMQFNNQIVRFGAESNLLTLNVYGPALINVNQATPSSSTAFGQGNMMTVGALNLSNTTLQVQGGNLYHFRAEGPITILGSQAAIQTNTDGPSGAVQLAGVISGTGALTKLGDGTLRGLVITNPNNTYSGGTNIVAGDVHVWATSGTPLGTGPVRVFPDGTLRLAANTSVDGSKLTVMSRISALGAVMVGDNFDPSVLNSTNFSSVYNTSLQLGQPYFNQALDMSVIGDGRAYLGGGLNTEVAYVAATLGAGAPDAWNPTVGVYRIAPATNSMAFSGVDNVLTGTNFLQVGVQRNNSLGTVVNGGNILVIRNSNDYTEGTQIAKGASIYLETGGRATGETPLGTGDIEVYGELRVRSAQGSLWNAATATTTNNVNLRPGGVLRLHDGDGSFAFQFIGAGDQGRWGDNVGLDLNGGILIFQGAPNFTSNETLGAITVRKGSQMQVFRNSTASAVMMNVSDISRQERGVLTLAYNNGFLGNNVTAPLSFERIVTGTIDGASVSRAGTTNNGAGVVNGGIVAPWIIDRTTSSFVGYDPTSVSGTGFQPLLSAAPGAGQLAYNQIVTGATFGSGIGADDIADLTTAAKTLNANPTLHALRSNQNISSSGGNNSITLGSGGLILTGGTINPLVSGAVPAMTLNFGASGAGEAFIYNGVGTSTIYAQINAAQGLTKFGPNQLNLYSINPGIGSDVVINEGTLFARLPFSGSGSPVGQIFNNQDVILNAGALVLEPFIANAAGTASEIASNVRAQAIFDSDIYVRGDATIGNNGNAQYARLADLTIANSASAVAMTGNSSITLTMQSGMWVRGTTTLAPEARINATFNGFSQSTLAGLVTGDGGIIKFGNGAVTLLGPNNDYSGGTVIWGSTNATAVSTVASGLRGAGTPFGTGDIQIQPGGLLRIADNANIAANSVYLRSDAYGLGGIGIAHNNVLPAIITSGIPAAGQIKVESTGPFDGTLALDYGFYSKALTPATIGNGNWWIGNSQQNDAYYFNPTIGASANGKYLLGGGGNQGSVQFGSVLVSGGRTSLFENVFSGGSANQVRIEVGAQTSDFTWNSPSFVNGNLGYVALTTRNADLIGDVRVNTNTTLGLGNNYALGNGRLIINGGQVRSDIGNNNFVSGNITLNNNVVLQGDFNTNAGVLVLRGNVAMSDVVGAGATRVWNMGGGDVAVRGVISGAIGSNLIKRGANSLTLSGANTYQGYTQIDRGTVVVAGNVLPNVAGPLGISESPIVLGVESTNNSGSIAIGGHFTVGRDLMVVAAAGTGVNLIESRTASPATVTGGVSINTGTILTLGSAAADVATFRGGQLDMQGSISGLGAVIIGTTAAAPANGGTVRLGGGINGYGGNTYAGGTTLHSARVQLNGSSYFSGPANSPTLISGPLGTGPITFGSGEGNRGAMMEAFGGPVTIANALNAISHNNTLNLNFGGYNALTFTRDLNLNSDASLRSRNFVVQNMYQPVTFSGNITNSSAAGSNLVKTGAGTLILTGTNTNANLLTTDGNYGTGVFIDAGILRVNSNAALGSTATLSAAGPHLAGPADVRLRGGYLSVTTGFTTDRQFILTNSNGGIDVASGETLTLTQRTAGAFNIRKVGLGTLALNNTANTIGTLTIGGGQQLNPEVGFTSHLGGIVTTNVTSGTPFATSVVNVDNGALALIGGGTAQALTIPTVNYGANGAIALFQGTTTSQLTATALTRLGAFSGVNFGTLTVVPSSLANLGATEKLLTSTASLNTSTGGGNILTVPSIFIRLQAAGSDANFARYDSTNGIMEHNVATVTTLGTTAGTDVADISAADTAGAGNIDIQALRTSANIAPTDGTTLLRIARGGLIINGNTASDLSANTLFGTGTGASLTEAIVYVRENQTGTSLISGNITARDFTKTGPGILEISGSENLLNTNATRLPVLSVQDGTFRFSNAGASFLNERRGTEIGDTIGHYVLNVNAAGVFDLNGLNLANGGIVGNGTITSGVAGSASLTVKNGFGVDPTFSGSITDGAGIVSLTKTQNGILILNGHSTHTGGTIVQAGRVTNATGSTAVLGRLEANTVTALGAGDVTLQGGTLRLNAANLLNGGQNISEVINGIDFLRWGGVGGLNVTVSETSVSNGISLDSNTTSYLNAATHNAGLNNLTVNAPMLTFAEGLFMIYGTSTFSQDNTVLRTAGGRAFVSGKIDAAGKTLTKTGANDLVLTNVANGAGQNEVGLWKVYGGLLEARTSLGSSNPFGSGTTVEINVGTNADARGLRLLTDGDGTNNSDLVTTYADLNLRLGSMTSVNSDDFVSSGSNRVQVGTAFIANNSFKTVQINNLEVGGALGSAHAYFVLLQNDSILVNGTTSFLRDLHLQVDNSTGGGQGLVLNGLISGNGTLNRRANGGTLYINADNSVAGGYDGGTFFTGGGRNYLGSIVGNQVMLSDTAKLGKGHVFVGANATLQINSAGNLQAGQNINVSSSLAWMANLSLAADLSLEQIRLRSYGLGGIQDSATDYYLNGRNPASGTLSLGTVYTHPLDMRTLGDGMWFLGSITNGIGANGAYDAATLAPGRGDAYRLGSGGNTLFFGTNGNANVLTDIDASKSSQLIIGTPMTVQNSGPMSGGSGTVVLLQNQNYTGSTVINRNSTLDFRGTLTTSGIETYGVLNVAGEAGTLINPLTSAHIPVTLRPGSTIRLDNTSAGVLPLTSTEGRWADSTPFNLNNSILRLQGNSAVEVTETVGEINADNGTNQIQIVRGVIGRGIELRTPAINRNGFSTVQFAHNGSQLGSDERLIITGTAPTVTNGMVLPWMVSASDLQFLTYNADTGLTIAGFDRVQGAATLTTTVTAPTDRTIINGAVVLNSGIDFDTYALRLSANVTQGSTTDTTAELIIRSGGLIVEGARTVTAAMRFGSTGSDEAIIHNNNTFTVGAFATPNTSGQIQAASITKNGGGNLQFLGNNAGFSGDIRLQQGTVELNYRNTTDVSTSNVVTTIGGNGGNIIFEGAGTILNLRGGTDGTSLNFTGNAVTFNKGIVLADYVPTATISVDRSGGTVATSQNKIFIMTGGITFGANNGDVGQVLRIDGRNAIRLQFNGTTTLNGRSAFAVENGYSGTATDLFLNGKVTGDGTLIKGPSDSKTRNMHLFNLQTLNDYTGGTVLQGGTLQVASRAANGAANSNTNLLVGGLGNGPITLMQGVLDLRVDSAASGAADGDIEFIRYTNTGIGQDVIVNGSSQINVDRTNLQGYYTRAAGVVTATIPEGHGYQVGQSVSVTTAAGATVAAFTLTGVTANTITYTDGTASSSGLFAVQQNSGNNKMITFNNLSIGSEILTVTGGNGYGVAFGGTTTLQGNAFFNNTADFVIGGGQGTTGAVNSVTTDGGQVLINKINTGVLWVHSANPNLTGPTYINAGLLDWGNRAVANGNATLGTGHIYANPNGDVRIRGVNNINSALGQRVFLTSTPYSSAMLRPLVSLSQVQLEDIIGQRTTTSNEVTYLSFEGGTLNLNLDQSRLGDGRIYFGGVSDRTYTGTGNGTVIPGLANHPNAVVGGDSTNRVYRFGHNSSNTLIINLAGTGNLNDYDSNATNVQIGSLATYGLNNRNTGFVYFQDQNTYTGQTVVSRGVTLRFNTSVNSAETAGPLGANAASLIDIYGGLRIEAGGSLRNFAGTSNFYSTINLHPLSTLIFQDTGSTTNFDRWDDTTGINLDGSALQIEAQTNNNDNRETVGAISFDRGSRIILSVEGTGDAFLTASSIDRAAASSGAGSGRGTLVFAPSSSAAFGVTPTAGVAQTQAFFTTAPTTSSVSAVAGMLPGYYVEGNAHRFVKNGANGILPVADGDMVPFTAGMTAGSAVVNITASTTLPDFNPVIYALRSSGNFALSSPTGANNDATVTFGGSASDVGGVISSASTFTINPNLKFGTDGLNEAIFYAGGNIQLNGNLTAGSVTKFGTGTLVIANDQSDAARGVGNGYSGGWVVNEGGLQLSNFGSAGNADANNTIVLNGSTASSGNLILRAQPGDTLLNYTYTSGRITAVDNATIDWDPGADDRVHKISDIEIQQSGGHGAAPTNGNVDAQLRIINNRSRSILAAGQLYVTNNAILTVDTTATGSPFIAYGGNGGYLTNGLSSGMSIAAINGSDRLTKWGDGTLYIRGDSSATFTGTMVIDQGAVHVTHNGSLGSGALIINRYGVLDVGVANFNPTNASVTFNEGSIERWSVNNARSGAVNLGKGTLQIAANQPTTSATVTLDGGGIEAFLRNDDINGAQAGGGVMRILNPNVNFVLNSNSFIGTQYYLGANGLDNGKQMMDNMPLTEYTTSGAILEVQGVISGAGGLSKVGYDTVILSGNNTYEGDTSVSGGRLLLGKDNALPVTTNLSTTSNGVLDLNGQNQTVGKLLNPVVTTAVNVTSGFITNSATTVKTLTVGNGIDVGDDFTFSGVIQHNVALTKTGSADMTLNNVNTYTGATHINGGAVKLGLNGSINDSVWLNVGAGSTFDVSSKTSYTYDGRISGGGSADAAGTAFASLTSAAKIVGNLVVGDHIGEICLVGTMSPGGNTIAGDISTAGNLIGHIQTSGDLTLSGQLAGSSPVVPVTRMTLQLGGATSSLTTLGYTTGDFLAFIDTLPTLSALTTDTLNGDAGTLSGHDYVKAGGTFSINANGRIEVSYLTGYTPTPGDVFNLLDWTALTNTGFTAGPRIRVGGETNYDLLLPTLGVDQFWDTSLFLSHGTLVVIPEPGRALLMLLGLMALAFRRRRQD